MKPNAKEEHDAPETILDGLNFDGLLDELPAGSGDSIGCKLGITSDEAGTISHKIKRRTFHDLTANSKRAEEVFGTIPQTDEAKHFLLDGSFVMAAIVPVILTQLGKCRLTICTLGLNDDTTDMLAAMLKDGRLASLRLAMSSYFRASDKITAERAIRILGKAGATLAVERVHAKLQLYEPTQSKARFTLETSSNLRSCNCVEVATMTNSTELFNFHDAWLTKFFLRNRITL